VRAVFLGYVFLIATGLAYLLGVALLRFAR
jgi:hypothetical protein